MSRYLKCRLIGLGLCAFFSGIAFDAGFVDATNGERENPSREVDSPRKREEVLSVQAKRWSQLDFSDETDPVLEISISPMGSTRYPELESVGGKTFSVKEGRVLRRMSLFSRQHTGDGPTCPVDTTDGGDWWEGTGGGDAEVLLVVIKTRTRDVKILASVMGFHLQELDGSVAPSITTLFYSPILARVIDDGLDSVAHVRMSGKLMKTLSGIQAIEYANAMYDSLLEKP